MHDSRYDWLVGASRSSALRHLSLAKLGGCHGNELSWLVPRLYKPGYDGGISDSTKGSEVRVLQPSQLARRYGRVSAGVTDMAAAAAPQWAEGPQGAGW